MVHLLMILCSTIYVRAQDCQYVNGETPALFEQPNGKGCYLIMGQNNKAIDKYYATVGGPLLAGATMYTNGFHWGITDPFHDTCDDNNCTCEYNHLQGYVDVPDYKNTFLHVGYYFAGAVAQRIRDEHDKWEEEVRDFAKWVKNCGHPVFLRIGFEAEFQYAGFAEFYKSVWRDMVDIFRGEGVENCAYVFQVAYGEGGWEPYYPGDEYVDWVGYSHWEGNRSGNFLNWAKNTVKKPVLISESAPHNGSCAVNKAWFENLNSWVKQHEDLIKGWAYISYNWVGSSGGCADDPDAGCWRASEQWGNTEIATDEEAKNYWLNTIVADDYYIKSDGNLLNNMYTNYGCSGPIIDCNGDENGTAYIDNCETCVGGNTGELPCEEDCNGEWGGQAYMDPNCNRCVGGSTGAVCEQDCHGDYDGIAFTDVCGNCVGGNTSETPCLKVLFKADKLIAFEGEKIRFSDQSAASIPITSYAWSFGDDASMMTADTKGPHEVSYDAIGLKTVSLTVNTAQGADSYTMELEIIAPRSPYGGTAVKISGTVQFENYDEDGSGISYKDNTPGNECSGVYRNDDVDVCDANNGTGGYVIAWTEAEEWMAYTVEVEARGLYTFTISYASGNGASVSIDFDSVDIANGPINLPATPNWDTYQEVVVEGVELQKGMYKLMHVSPNGGVNLDYVTISLTQEIDCHGDLEGDAYIDDCGDCVGGSTGLMPCLVGSSKPYSHSLMSIYPNPVSENLRIKGLSKGIHHAVLYNAQGSRIQELTIDGAWNVAHLPHGIYVLLIDDYKILRFSKK